jgi:hypothetical protein
LLKEAKKIYTKSRMQNKEELEYLQKAVDFSTKVKSKISVLYNKKEEINGYIMKYYE